MESKKNHVHPLFSNCDVLALGLHIKLPPKARHILI